MREPAPGVDGGLSGSVQVGQAKDVPLVEESGESTSVCAGSGACAGIKRLVAGSRRQGVFGFAVKREMNKTSE